MIELWRLLLSFFFSSDTKLCSGWYEDSGGKEQNRRRTLSHQDVSDPEDPISQLPETASHDFCPLYSN